jgi:DNA-binding transcriptional LysR family regulator
MTLRQFEVFLAVARAKSFRRAAEALHLSQPALSQHVRELETELGARLFDRLPRLAVLSEAGRVLEEHAARLFATLADARQAIAEVAGLQRGSLVIGASTTPGIYVLPRILGLFRQRHPGIELTLRLGNSAAIERLVRANELDLGLVGGHGLAPREECLAAGLTDELLLVVPPGHAWGARREVPPADLPRSPLLLREVGSATRQLTEQALQTAGVRYQAGLVLEHTEAIKQAVLAGLGVAFVSEHAVRGEVATGRLCALRLRGLRIVRHFHVIHHEARRLGTAARALMELTSSIRLDPLRRDGAGRRARDAWATDTHAPAGPGPMFRKAGERRAVQPDPAPLEPGPGDRAGPQ